MQKFLTRLARNKEGNALMLLAAGLIPVTLMIGSGVDASIAYTTRAELQNACDAGALAGRLAMVGDDWNEDTEAEARKFFDFNFPEGTNGVDDVEFTIEQDEDDPSQVIGSATGTVPTTLMFIFGYKSMDLAVDCDAKRDMGHNDVMLVLDVTGSMNDAPSIGGDTKINRLRNGVNGLYRALDDGNSDSHTRFGFVPYSQTVNVGRLLTNQDIVRRQYFVDVNTSCNAYGYCTETANGDAKKLVGPRDSSWNNGQNGASDNNAIIQGFRTSGWGCIEERPSNGRSYNDGEFRISETVTIEDVNDQPRNATDTDKQFGRYEPETQTGVFYDACASESKEFAEYDDEAAFGRAVTETTARVGGGTYSDIGMLWGLRLASRDGFLAAKNSKKNDTMPVNVHIIFFTDGMINAHPSYYSAYGFERWQNRISGDGTFHKSNVSSATLTAAHRRRFANTCTLAKSMGMTVWVVTLDTAFDPVHRDCATSAAHFYESDGDDLEDKFTQIGQGIGNLRLTR